MPNHSAFRKRNRTGEHSQRQEVTKLRRITTWPRIANVHKLDHTEPIECTIDVIRRILVQAGMSFRGIATTQEIRPIRRLASQFTMQSRKPSPALRRLRYSGSPGSSGTESVETRSSAIFNASPSPVGTRTFPSSPKNEPK